jgi:hypothetical protein
LPSSEQTKRARRHAQIQHAMRDVLTARLLWVIKEYGREAGARAAKYTGKCTIITHVSQGLILGMRSPHTKKTRILCSRDNDGQLPASECLVSCRHSTQRPGASQARETLGICRADKATELHRFTEGRAETTFIYRTYELYRKTPGISARDNQDKTQCEDEEATDVSTKQTC